ncbi:hypothetical protein RFM41_23985 [Mesorhizobium sp. VK25A]|uniref:Thymidylate kinase-like domain-containing protein n=3 Tax=Mesorhizobium TaxID=68287 RepID=A0ABU5ADH1_9HYPH|nr:MULTISPECIES: hypothetical protein [unclassified Mesorhizobium]MDX8469786.1 hypothetical protein [Mesorhizobium sp. VK23B]MDX8476125.1 hypothetical protein [Mesorhizobium sp. VK23A]MDX8508378.1 hypothetical protein [Mesorhizobium sp. VK22E]MDX8535329.1 hypothetical protein [Mesorhizobium sp. VK25D]MDX8546829.1 hypothetical protein [Mesorhizobium sp. VK25A]
MGRTIVAFDGPSGVGKSSLLPQVISLLADRGQQYELFSNVESSSLNTLIRKLASSATPGLTLSLALSTARAELIESNMGNLLLDRFVLSGLVYQPISGVDQDFVYASNAPLLEGVTTVALEITAIELGKRRRSRGPMRSDFFKDRLDIETEISLFAERAEFLRSKGHVVITLDAGGTIEDTAMNAVNLITACGQCHE